MQIYALPFKIELYNDQKPKKCSLSRCLGLDEVIELTKKNGYDTQKNTLELLRRQYNIKVKLSRLIPSINLSFGVATALSDLSVIPSLCGFIFPHNWFSWRESKLFYQAQKESFISLMANSIRYSQQLYVTLHQEMIETDIYKHHYKMMENIIAYLDEERKKTNLISEFDLSRVKVLFAQAKVNALFLENEFKDTLPLLGHLIALPIEEEWDRSSIKFLNLPNLMETKHEDANALYDEVIKISPEIKSINYLIAAAPYARKKRIFNFLDPNGGPDNSLGYGYLSQIRISETQMKTLKVKLKEKKSLLKVNVHAQVLNYNAGIDTYIQNMIGRKASLLQLRKFFEDYHENKIFKIDNLTEAMQSALNFDLQRNKSQHYFMTSKAQVERLLLNHKYYEDLEKYIPKRKKLKFFKNWTKRREERKMLRKIPKKKKFKRLLHNVKFLKSSV